MIKGMIRLASYSRPIARLPRVRFASTSEVPPVVHAPAKVPPPTPGPQGGKKGPKRSIFGQLFRLGVVATIGSAVYFTYSVYEEIVFPNQKPVDKTKPKLIIVGSGWGSVGLLKTLDFSKYDVTVVSARNYFLFTPLLPSTATGLIEHRSIMEPTRAILRKKPVESQFIEGEVTHVDPYRKVVTVKIHGNSHKNVPEDRGLPELEQEISYDKLVLGVGATTNSFNIEGVNEFACYLKETEDAQKIRKRIMDCMEAASVPGLPKEERRRLMHAVVVGAGPTGVEFAGELHDFVYNDLRKFNPEIVKDFKVSLIEGMPQILPAGFNKELVKYAIDTMEKEQIKIMTQTMVTGADAQKVYATRTVNGEKEPIELDYGLFVWAGGTGVRKLIRDMFTSIPEQAKQRRGLKVDEFLRVRGVEDVWAVGDCADAGLAPTAQVAGQEGVYVGQLLDRLGSIDELKQLQASRISDEAERRSIDRQLRRLGELPQFKYSHQGSLAYIGSDKALADLQYKGKNYALSGTITYFFWRSAYLSMCFSLRNKLLVALDWTKVLLFGRDISRE